VKRGEIVGNRKVGNSIAKGRVTYKKLFEEFYNTLQIRGRAEQTLISYKYHNKYFAEFIGDDLYCDEITIETIENYIRYIKNVKKIKNGVTINSYLRNISPILKYGMRKGYILRDFLIPVVKEQEIFKEIYTQEEIKELLKKPKEREFVILRTWAIIWTFASTGIRARELRELKVGAIDLLNRTIAVNVTKNKKARYLPI
jgi:integrase/recombinase XerD